MERLLTEIHELRKTVAQLTTEIALLKAWRKEHMDMHRRDEARHARAPSMWMNAIVIGLMFAALIATILLRGGA